MNAVSSSPCNKFCCSLARSKLGSPLLNALLHHRYRESSKLGCGWRLHEVVHLREIAHSHHSTTTGHLHFLHATHKFWYGDYKWRLSRIHILEFQGEFLFWHNGFKARFQLFFLLLLSLATRVSSFLMRLSIKSESTRAKVVSLCSPSSFWIKCEVSGESKSKTWYPLAFAAWM